MGRESPLLLLSVVWLASISVADAFSHAPMSPLCLRPSSSSLCCHQPVAAKLALALPGRPVRRARGLRMTAVGPVATAGAKAGFDAGTGGALACVAPTVAGVPGIQLLVSQV